MQGWIDMKQARRAYACIKYAEENITDAITRGLLSLSYTDNTEKADDIQITVEDIDGNWAGPWYPKVAAQKPAETPSAKPAPLPMPEAQAAAFLSAATVAAPVATAANNDFSDITTDGMATKPAGVSGPKVSSARTPHAATGTVLDVTIIAESWDDPGKLETLHCGSFEVDGMKIDGPPSTASINGVSIPLTSSIRRERRSDGWEDTTLQEVALDITNRAGLSLVYELDNDPHLDRVDQWHEPDLPFLQKLCANHGATLKVTDNQVVIFDEAKYEARDPIVTIQRGDKRLLAYSFTQDTANTASSATTSYKDPKSGKLVTETFAPENAPAVGQSLQANYRPADLSGDNYRQGAGSGNTKTIDDFADVRTDAKGTAAVKAKSMLRAANKGEWKCNLKSMGNVRMVSGSTFLVSGFGVFDGKYIAETVTHTLDGGYINDITGHRVLEGY